MTERTTRTEYVGAAEAQRLLPYEISPRTLGRMADRGTITAIRLPSGYRRYLRSDIEALAQGKDGAA